MPRPCSPAPRPGSRACSRAPARSTAFGSAGAELFPRATAQPRLRRSMTPLVQSAAVRPRPVRSGARSPTASARPQGSKATAADAARARTSSVSSPRRGARSGVSARSPSCTFRRKTDHISGSANTRGKSSRVRASLVPPSIARHPCCRTSRTGAAGGAVAMTSSKVRVVQSKTGAMLSALIAK